MEPKYLLMFDSRPGDVHVECFKFDLTWNEVLDVLKLRVESKKEFFVVDMEDVPKYLDFLLLFSRLRCGGELMPR